MHCGKSSHISGARKEGKGVLFKSIVHNPEKVLDGSEALRGDVQIRRTSGDQEHMEMESWLLFQKKRRKFQDVAEVQCE